MRRGRSYLDAVGVVVQQKDSKTGHLLGLHHRLHVCQEVHVFGHVCGEHLKKETTKSETTAQHVNIQF